MATPVQSIGAVLARALSTRAFSDLDEDTVHQLQAVVGHHSHVTHSTDVNKFHCHCGVGMTWHAWLRITQSSSTRSASFLVIIAE